MFGLLISCLYICLCLFTFLRLTSVRHSLNCWWRCLCPIYSSVVRAFAHGAMGRRIDPTWGGPIELSCLWDGAYKITLAVNRKE